MDIYISEKQEEGHSKLIKACHNVRINSIRIIDNTLRFTWVDHIYTKDYEGLDPFPTEYPSVRFGNQYHIHEEVIELEGKEILFKE